MSSQETQGTRRLFNVGDRLSVFSAYVFLTAILLGCFRYLELPDPIKLIKRISALEIALGNLKEDCETIATKRLQVVQKIVASQCQTVSHVKEVRYIDNYIRGAPSLDLFLT